MYETMFAQYGITCAQILVTKNDFKHRSTVDNLRDTINDLLLMNVVPIINENDAVSPPGNVGADLQGVLSVTDNDSLAANMAVQLNADVLVVLSDVDGIYRYHLCDSICLLLLHLTSVYFFWACVLNL